MGIEVKFYDQKLIGSVINAPSDATAGEQDPSATVLMNTVVQGDGESQRDGRKITMRSIYVEGAVTLPVQSGVSVADAPSSVFLALVMDKQTNGATIASEDVFVNPGANAATGAFPFRNLENSKRFRILATRKFTFDQPNMANDTGATGGLVVGGRIKKFKMFKKLNMQVNYKGTTETVANITDVSLHMIGYCSSTDLAPNLSYHSRLRFVG